MSDHPDAAPEPVDYDRLNGWKEIASFLGKGVRTAQRWEKDYGLPIHRLGREGGEIIFASRAELTAWLARGGNRDSGHTDTGDDDEAVGQASPETQGPEVVGTAGRRWAWLLAGATVVALLLSGLLALTRPAANPAHWHAVDNRLVVYGADDEEVFQFDPELDLDEAFLNQPFASTSGGHGVVYDLDGDGLREVLFAPRGPTTSPNLAFYILDHEGTVLAKIRPQQRVTFGDVEYLAPWLPYRVFVNPRPGLTPAIHVAFVHGQNFPTLLLEIDSRGNTLAEYWSNGYVHTVTFLRWRGLDVLAVGASNNDFQGSSLALFESGRATGSAPAAKHEYRCSTCSPIQPFVFIVFPRRCVAGSAVVNGTGSVGHVWTDADGSIFVDVEEGTFSGNTGHFVSLAKYTLDADLNLLRVEPTTGMLADHDSAFKEGLVDHSFSPERDGPDFFPVRVWRGGGFVDLPPAPIDWSQYGGR